MRVLFISTIQHNPGDDFIRWGQHWLLRTIVPGLQSEIVHKHDPRSVYASFELRRSDPHRLLAPLLYDLYSWKSERRDLLADADLVVFAGAPFIWRQNTSLLRSTSANAEWNRATWDRLFEDFPGKTVINIAAGTSLLHRRDVASVLDDSTVTAFLKKAVERAQCTTARDRITASILSALGAEVPCLPCTSLWAPEEAELSPQEPAWVAVNFMPHGTHPGRGRDTSPARWRETAAEVVTTLSKRHRIRFVCHSRAELKATRSEFPTHEAFYSADPREILCQYSRALYTVSNRVHGAAAGASFGRPAVGIGGDTRMTLLDEIGLPHLSTQSSADAIVGACDEVELHYEELCSEIRSIRDESEGVYRGLLADAAEMVRSSLR